MKFKKTRQQGFTLVEMAMVLVILGFVLAALLLPIQAQRQQLAQSQTENTLESAKQALLGFAQSQGRLPCPATAANGAESPLGGGTCTQQVGFLPAATLGIQPTNSLGFAIDAWNNPIRYAITADESSGFGSPRNNNPNQVIDGTHPACTGDIRPDFTTTGNLAEVGLVCLAPNLRVCATSLAANCSNAVNLINNAVAVIYSIGATGAQGFAGRPDETENLNAVGVGQADTTFVSHDISLTAAPNEFDHLVTWISPYVLYNAMIQAGQLH